MMSCLVRLSIHQALMTIVYTTHRTDATNIRTTFKLYVNHLLCNLKIKYVNR